MIKTKTTISMIKTKTFFFWQLIQIWNQICNITYYKLCNVEFSLLPTYPNLKSHLEYVILSLHVEFPFLPTYLNLKFVVIQIVQHWIVASRGFQLHITTLKKVGTRNSFYRRWIILSSSPLVKSCIHVSIGFLDFCSVIDRCFCQSSTSPSKPKTCHLDSIVIRRVELWKHNIKRL
jgi:hypothetical protein